MNKIGDKAKKIIYVDNAATTRITDEVLAAMMPYLTTNFGNASSIYSLGVASAKAIKTAREQIANAINAQPSEILFTSCGSESDNWLKIIAYNLFKAGKTHIITSCIEHHAMLHSMAKLEELGFTVTYLPVSSDGFVSVEDFQNAITNKTGLASIMFANNEIGTIQPITKIGAICHKNGIWFHTDAVQAVGHIPVDVQAMNIDMLSMSGHKFHAPKGIGAFYCRHGVPVDNLIDGGGQERGLRSGTENVASIVGMGVALQNAVANMEKNNERITGMRDRLIDGLLQKIPDSRLNGSRENRLPGNVNISFAGIDGESLLLALDQKDIMVSAGSACASGSLDASHVILALGVPDKVAHGSIRFSLSEETTEEDIDTIIQVVPNTVEIMRNLFK